MIKSNELRIGNCILFAENDRFHPLFIKAYHIVQLDDFPGLAAFMPLTYDFLIKHCGFVDYAKNGWGCRLYLDSSTELCWYIQDCVVECTVRYQSRGSRFTHNFGIKYVHQLQNLYFIITGKELEIKI